MNETPMHRDQDVAGVVIRPPKLWLLAVLAVLLNYWIALPFMPADWPNEWIGGGLFVFGFLLAIWAFRQFREFRGDVDTHTPTQFIADTGPFAFSRNPIYLGMLVSIVGVAVGFNTAWVLIALLVWYPIMHWGVIAREEAYLERKFGEIYLAYKRRVRRWL